MEKNISDIACAILGATNDGDDLAPTDLALVQATVNGQVNELGEAAFYELWDRVRSGYREPWLHGIEHLTRDHQGYVLWKGMEVEHYDGPWCYSEEAKGKATEVARRCRVLEDHGVKVNTTNVIWRWDEWAQGRNLAT